MAWPVNIKVYTFCYNSELILPFIINYWKQYATSVVVYDNMSTDKSVEILSKYDWIEVRHFDTNKKHDPDKMMQIKNNCVNESKSSKADYVMICDLDEVLYCYDSLLYDLAIAKQNGIKVFNSVYYNAIVNKFPASSLSLLQNISGVKLVKNINVNKVLLFDPSINIKFSNLQNNCTYDNNIKTGDINIIHNKMIGLDRFLNEQLDYIKRINKTNKYAMTYGASKNSCVAIFNNIYAKSFQPLYKAINQRIVLNNCKLPELKTESKQVLKSNIIPETKNSSFNFTDIEWKPAKIQYNTPACGNKDLVIVIPVYKADLDKYEQMSLQRLSLVIKTSFDIVLVMPEGLNIESYNNIYPGKINTLALNKQYFCNRKGYSYLCETTLFYECFSDYKFMLIYQLDGWIFKNDLNRFIKMDYDYIGAPWKQSLAIPRTVGNGGVSLRKISKFIEICKQLDPKDINEKYAAQIEDIFFCLYVKKKLKDKFNIAPVNVGLDFCIDKNPTYWMSESKGKLPMCVHAFQKHYSYWEDKFNNADIKSEIALNEKEIDILNNKDKKENIEDGISICISAYKAQKYIKETLESVKNQTWFKTHDNWECLVGIDGCQETYKYILTIINEYDKNHFKFYMMDSNKGTYITSNTLMGKIAKYDWLLRFDSDDIMHNNMVETIMNDKGDSQYIRWKLLNFASEGYKGKDANDCYMSYGLIMINRNIFLKYGGYLPWQCSGDNEMITRISKFIKIKEISKILFKRRVTASNLTHNLSTGRNTETRKKYETICSKLKRTKISEDAAIIKMTTNTYYQIFNIALCTIAKNENLYIKEWVDYYKDLGISKIFLYDNNDLDGERFEDVIGDYINSGYVCIIDKRGILKGKVFTNNINLLPLCYIECYNNLVSNFDWVCYFDIDEFLSIRNKMTLTQLLSDHKFDNMDTICVSWETYDDNNKLKYEDEPVLKRFTHISRRSKSYHGVKSIVRTNKEINNIYQEKLIHLFLLKGENICNILGDRIQLDHKNWWIVLPDNIHRKSTAVLNHYKTKTIEEYLRRHLGRYWGTSSEDSIIIKDLLFCLNDYFKYNNQTAEKILLAIQYEKTH